MKRLLLLTITALWFATSAIAAPPESESEIISTVSIKVQIDKESVKYTEKYLNGQVAKTGTYYKDKMHGVWQKFNLDGSLSYSFNYNKGIREGSGWVYENGDIKYEIIYSKGERIEVIEY